MMSNQTNNPAASDLSVMIKRLPHNQTYKLDLLVIEKRQAGQGGSAYLPDAGRSL